VPEKVRSLIDWLHDRSEKDWLDRGGVALVVDTECHPSSPGGRGL